MAQVAGTYQTLSNLFFSFNICDLSCYLYKRLVDILRSVAHVIKLFATISYDFSLDWLFLASLSSLV
jgi:hypothetical protein